MITRREMLKTMAGAALLAEGAQNVLAQAVPTSRMGIVQYALAVHQKNQWGGAFPGLAAPVAFLEQCRHFGAGGMQVPFDPQNPAAATEVRRRAERYGMFVEAIIEPPAADADIGTFEAKVRTAKEAGASLARCTIMPGRRYEQFKTLDEMREFEKRGEESLRRAIPILERHRFRLAVENHKDQLIEEKLAMMKRLGSEFIGMCVDVSNNFSLLDDPLDAVRAFAPLALTVHVKDHFLYEHPDGFLVEDTAMGDGFLDLPAIVDELRKAKPDVKFSLESITREPILIPVLKQDYYATMPEARASALARTLNIVKANKPARPPRDYAKMAPGELQALEKQNVERSIVYAREKLGL